ncbi:N-6 DNA methylase [Micromonospora sp. CA-259024]|uniref:N-6 DNA methylase n=1 Tax=Micromonospora sp. CA-259024 TaxID=3239965 RepID=UPI003D8DC077
MGTDHVEVTSADIARIARVKPTAVSNWRRRHDDFPKAVGGTDRSPRFDLGEVESWLRSQGRTGGIPADQRLWQAFDSVRAVMAPGDALSAVGLLMLHLREHPDVAVPTEPAELSDLLSRAARMFPAGMLGTDVAGLTRGLRQPEASRLATVLTAAVDAARDAEPGEADGPAKTFETLCSRFLDTGGRAGFTATPPELAELMVQLAGTPAGTLLDPACGSGTILLTAAARGYQRILGQELDPSIARLAALRLAFSHPGERPMTFDIEPGDSLRRPAFPLEQAAAVVSNPPFADRNWGYDELLQSPVWAYGAPARGESELAWAQQSLAHVVPGGAVVILMPPAVAFRPSGRRNRKELLARGALRAIISLPPGLAAHYSLALQIWILRRPVDRLTPDHLLVMDATGGAGTTKSAAGSNITPTWVQVCKLVTESWEKFCADPAGFPDRPGVARAVPVTDLLDEETDLTPRRHLPLPPPPTVSGEELTSARERFTRLLSTLGDTLVDTAALPDLDHETVRSVPLSDLSKTGVVFIRRASSLGAAHNQEEARSVHRIEGRIVTGTDIVRGQPPSQVGDVDGDEVRNPPIRTGDILVPIVAHRLTARVAAAEDIGAYPASTVYLVRVDPAVLDPWFLAGYLSSNDGARQAERVGSSLGGDIRVDLRRVRVPLLPLDTQRAYGRTFQRLSDFTRNLRAAHDLGLELARSSIDAIASGLTFATEASPSAP